MSVGNSHQVLIVVYQLCYINRLYHMSDEKIAKKVYNDLISFHHQGFNTWATGAMELLDDLKLDITMNTKSLS